MLSPLSRSLRPLVPPPRAVAAGPRTAAGAPRPRPREPRPVTKAHVCCARDLHRAERAMPCAPQPQPLLPSLTQHTAQTPEASSFIKLAVYRKASGLTALSPRCRQRCLRQIPTKPVFGTPLWRVRVLCGAYPVRHEASTFLHKSNNCSCCRMLENICLCRFVDLRRAPGHSWRPQFPMGPLSGNRAPCHT